LFSDSRENLAVLTAVRKQRVAGRLRLAAGGAGSAVKSITPASCNTPTFRIIFSRYLSAVAPAGLPIQHPATRLPGVP